MTTTKIKVITEQVGHDVYHKVEGLPHFAELSREVKRIVSESSYWERHGANLVNIGCAFPLHLLGLVLCGFDSPSVFSVGFILLGLCHSTIANRAGHLAAHNALFESLTLNAIARRFLMEFVGFFSEKVAMEIHIAEHHPYTNIIGIGDSSSWKAPSLPRYVYMFFAPFTLPVLTPIVAVQGLKGSIIETASFLSAFLCGLALNVFLIMRISGFTTIYYAVLFLFAFRAVTTVPYIHINIFQHIGLPMYALQDRPHKIYQMSTGVLNLDSQLILDWIMGHTLVSCHVEHHLFPTLSDTMALKVRPTVKRFFQEHGLPYHEKSYSNRLALFISKYDELMVKAPPITHFVGIQ